MDDTQSLGAHNKIMYAETQDDDWARALSDHEKGALRVPRSTVIKLTPDCEILTVSFDLSKDKDRWYGQISGVSKRIARGEDEVVGSIILGMGSLLKTKDPEAGSIALFSMAKGVGTSDLPGARVHLISHMTLSDEPPFLDRIVAAPVLEDGSLGDPIDSGYSDTVVTT